MIYGGTPKCPNCGRELVGVSVIYGNKWLCSDCAKDTEDPIHCERGCKVEFAYPNNGMPREREDVGKILTEGSLYEVESVAVGGYTTWIKLREFPGKRFNSVFFRRVS